MRADSSQASDGIYQLYGPKDVLVYKDSDKTIPVNDPKLKVVKIDVKTGQLTPMKARESISGKGLFWLRKK